MSPLASYSLTILWRERGRFVPAVLAVTFSAVLIASQCGMLLGSLGATSRPIDRAGADVWLSAKPVPSLGFSQPVPGAWVNRLRREPEIVQTEPYLFGFGLWHKPGGGTEICYVIGSRLEAGSLGAFHDLTPQMRSRLEEPGTVVVAERDRNNLGFTAGVGEVAEISGCRVRIVGLLSGINSLGFPGIFCSLRTARRLLAETAADPDSMSYVLARCGDPRQGAAVAGRLNRRYPHMTVLTREEFSLRTRIHWLTKTKAGVALGFSAVLGLVVGGVVTSQTLYAATAASLREHAVLRALGLPRWRLQMLVLAQSFWIGLAGVALALPAAFGIERLVQASYMEMSLPVWLLVSTGVLTLVMALVSGLAALRPLRQVDPITLLR